MKAYFSTIIILYCTYVIIAVYYGKLMDMVNPKAITGRIEQRDIDRS